MTSLTEQKRVTSIGGKKFIRKPLNNFEIDNILKESKKLNQELGTLLKIPDVQLPVNVIKEIQESKKLTIEWTLLQIQLQTLPVYPDLNIDTGIKHITDIKETVSSINTTDEKTRFKIPCLGQILFVTGTVANIFVTGSLTALGVPVPISMVVGAGVSTLVVNIPTIIENPKTGAVHVAKAISGSIIINLFSPVGLFIGSFLGNIVATVSGNIINGTIWGYFNSQDMNINIKEPEKIQLNSILQKAADDKQTTETKSFTMQKMLYVSAVAGLTMAILSGKLEGTGTTAWNLYKTNPYINNIVNSTVLKLLLSEKVIRKLSEWSEKRAEQILGKYASLKLRDNEFIKRKLSAKILNTLLFNITLVELTKQFNQATVQALGVKTISSIVEAAEKPQETKESIIDLCNMMVSGSQAAVESVKTQLDSIGQVTKSAAQSIQEIISTAVATGQRAAANELFLSHLEKNQPTSVKTPFSTLESTFSQQSTLQQNVTPVTTDNMGPSYDQYKAVFEKEYPQIAQMLPYLPKRLVGLGYLAAASNVPGLGYVVAARSALYGSTVASTLYDVTQRQGEASVVTKTLGQTELFVESIEDAFKTPPTFSIEEAILASYGYHPTLSQGDVFDRVLLGDSVHEAIEQQLGQGLGESIVENVDWIFDSLGLTRLSE